MQFLRLSKFMVSTNQKSMKFSWAVFFLPGKARLRLARLDLQQAGLDKNVPAVTLSTRKADITISKDEGPSRARPDKIPSPETSFQ
jgi:hypothetical protein